MARHFSYDVFDTLLTRHFWSPEHVFLAAGEALRREGLWREPAEAFRALRVRCERRARRAVPGEVTLDDIYAELRREAGDALATRARALELELELGSVSGIRTNLDEAVSRRAAGDAVCFVSDMYLPEATVREMLRRVGAPEAPLFLSSTHRRTKASGELFHVVAQHLGIPLADLEHCGDNPGSDLEVPRRLGARARRYTGIAPTLVERAALEALTGSDLLDASALAGALRAARLAQPRRDDPHAAALGLFGTQLGALVHVAFVLWVLDRLAANGADRVFFLARDGFLPHRLYALCREADPALPPATYLHVSRQALHRASLGEVPEDHDRQWMLVSIEGLLLSAWLRRLGLDGATFGGAERRRFGLPADDLRIDAALAARCRHLVEDPGFWSEVRARNAEGARLARRHLEQEGFLAATRPALVDIGWNGRMQRSLARIAGGPADLVGLYLGLERIPPAGGGRVEAWLFDPRDGRGRELAGRGGLYETLFAAPHGSLLGYAEAADGAVVPRLQPDPSAACYPALAVMHEGVLDVMARFLRARRGRAGWPVPSVPHVARAIVRWLHHPTAVEAAAFLEFRFGADQAAAGHEQLLYALRDRELLGLVLRGGKLGMNHWVEGQVALARHGLTRGVAAGPLWLRAQARRLRRAVKDRRHRRAPER